MSLGQWEEAFKALVMTAVLEKSFAGLTAELATVS
jgi:hypothetical protein